MFNRTQPIHHPTKFSFNGKSFGSIVYGGKTYNSANCDVYGGLYQWAEMVQYLNGGTNTTLWNPIPTEIIQGICPSGWLWSSKDEQNQIKFNKMKCGMDALKSIYQSNLDSGVVLYKFTCCN